MALQLDPTLAWAQDQKSRHPRIEIKSQEKVGDIPFDGQALTLENFDEFQPSVITHSSGRLFLTYMYGPDGSPAGVNDRGMKFAYTDVNRLEFTIVTNALYKASDGYTMLACSCCEITGGNIGIVYFVKTSSNYYLKSMVVSPLGVLVAGSLTSIANWATSTWTDTNPWVVTLGTNSYMMVYVKISGSDYNVVKRTSSNFTAWGAESALSIAGLTSTKYKRNASLTMMPDGDVWLWVDYTETLGANNEELRNIYYSISTNSGVDWGSAVGITSYTAYSEVAIHPVAVAKTATEISMMFTKMITALQMTDSEPNWPTGADVTHISVDEPNGTAYLTCIYNSAGTKYLECVVKVDLATWEVLDAWDTTTSPGFPAILNDDAWWMRDKGERYLIPVSTSNYNTISVLNGEDSTIINYYFQDVGAYSITKNMDYTLPTGGMIRKTKIDFDSNRLYVLIDYSYKLLVGYISLDDAGPAYAFNVVASDTTVYSSNEMVGLGTSGYGDFDVVPGEDWIIVSSLVNTLSTWSGFLTVYNLSSGLLHKLYRYSSYSNFPHHGIGKFVCYGGKIYGGTYYQSGYGQGDIRGLCEINPNTDEIIMHRPTYTVLDTYMYWEFPCIGDNGDLIFPHWQRGIAIFNAVSQSWTLWDNDNVSGLTPGGTEEFTAAGWWSGGGMILTAQGSTSSAWNGLVMLSIYGTMLQTSYSVGLWGGASWNWSDIDPMVLGYRDDSMVGTSDPDDSSSMYVFWRREEPDTGEESIMWDKEGSVFDLSPYLVNGEEVVCERSIEQKPNTLSFVASHGHLFDPFNPLSLLSPILKKGRKITLRWGEEVGETTYWQNGGSFYVTQASLSFERDKYTNVQVDCEDERVIWGSHEPVTTEYYYDYPEIILADLLQEQAGITEGNIDIPDFDDRTQIESQWIETPMMEVLNQLCSRYGYYFRMTVDNKANTRKVSMENSVDHLYADLKTIIRYAPNDKYSDFVNRVIVIGQERDFIEVQFPEERIQTVHGTCGWWGYKNDFDIYYSQDGTRRCINPRLVIIESSTSIGFKLSGSITESISFEDPNDFYCVLTVSAPNLTYLLGVGVALLIIAHFVPDFGVGVGYITTIPFGRILEKVGIFICLMVLGSVGNFQYEIWATPLGKVRRTVQNQADDEEAQSAMGSIVSKKFEDPLCYNTADCLTVAEYELMVAKAQRRRLGITKVAHLQDEEGDTIGLPHPYSGAMIYMFLTNLVRKMKIGKDGYFLDEIEGWVRT